MNRSYLPLVIVAALTLSAARGLPDAPAVSAELTETAARALRFCVVVSGGLALRAI